MLKEINRKTLFYFLDRDNYLKNISDSIARLIGWFYVIHEFIIGYSVFSPFASHLICRMWERSVRG